MRIPLLLLFSVIIGLSAVAQNQIVFADEAYLQADQQLYILTEIESVGESGNHQTWDFSGLKNKGEIISFLKPIHESEFEGKCPQSNMLIQEGGRSWLIKASSEGLEEYGSSGGRSILIYDKPIRRFPFPFEYGSALSGEYSGRYLGSQSAEIKGFFSTEADGAGTLILPGDVVINDVIRVRFTQSRENGPAYITYRWYAAKSDPVLRYPLLSIITSEKQEELIIVQAAYYANAKELSIQEIPYSEAEKPYEYISIHAADYDLKIYPNPFVDHATIEFTLPDDARVTLQVFDNMGRTISTLTDKNHERGTYTQRFDASNHFICFVRLSVNGEVVASRKLIQLPR